MNDRHAPNSTVAKLIAAMRRGEVVDAANELLAKALQVGGCSPTELRKIYGFSTSFYHEHLNQLPPRIKIGRRVIHPWRGMWRWEEAMLDKEGEHESDHRKLGR